MKAVLPPLLVLAASLAARAQGVGIGTPAAAAGAALEIKATNAGLLIPRLTAGQRTALVNPPQGLLVYQTDGTASGGTQTGFWYYGGSGGWVFLNTSAGSGFTLPFSGSYGGSGTAFDVSHTGGGVAISGAAPNTGVGVYGSSSTGSGVYGTASGSGGYGVRGNASAANSAALYGSAAGANTYGAIGSGETGVLGQGGSGAGLSALSLSGPALLAAKSGSQPGRVAELTLAGTGNDSTAVYVSSAAPRPALRVVNANTSAQAALRGVKTAGTDGVGVEGVITSGGGNAAGVLGNDRSNSSFGSGVTGLTTTGYGVRGVASGSGGYGVAGSATTSYGVIGSSSSGAGVYGSSSSAAGVNGFSSSGSGVVGTSSASAITLAGVQGVSGSGGNSVGVLGTTTGGYGVRGTASASGGYGVSGQATNGFGVIGSSDSGSGVYGTTTANDNAIAGVQGVATNGSNAVGVLGQALNGYGVRGEASSSPGSGVYGKGTGTYGVFGTSDTGRGVYGVSTSSYGVQGYSTSSFGVYGATGAGNTGTAAGVTGNASSGGVGVLGSSTSGYGVRGEASSGYGVIGVATQAGGYGVFGATSGAATAVLGQATGTGRAGYFNQINGSSTANALEVQNSSLGRTAFFNQSNTNSSTNAVAIVTAGTTAALKITHPTASSLGAPQQGILINDPGGVNSVALNSYGVRITGAAGPSGSIGNSVEMDAYGTVNVSTNSQQALLAATGANTTANFGTITSLALGGGYAGYFLGNVYVNGSVAKSGGSFKIDHPLDPENQYLYHSFVESPDMLNVYNGNVTLDASGEAVVELPDYFEALNRDFRYQLTSLGAFMPVFVKEKVAGNRFRIAGGTPGGEVSWQVTGIRHDKWADQNRIPNAMPKEPENRGRYLAPAAYGQPAERGIGYRATEAGRAATRPAPAAR